MANRDKELAAVSWSYFGCTCTLWSVEGAPDGGARPHRFLASGRPRDGKSAELRSRKHTTARENLAELIMRPHAALAEVTKRDRRVFRHNWRTLRARVSSFISRIELYVFGYIGVPD